MTGTVDAASNVQMLVPHRVSPQSRNIFRQSALDKGSRGWGRRCIASDEWESPSWCTVPQVFHGWVVV